MKTYSIGREPGCDILINDATGVISRRHAILNIAPSGKMTIVDQSTNGTYINGIRITPNVPVPVTKKDTVSFAHIAKLDWRLVPSSSTLLKYILIGVAAVALFVGAGYGIWAALTSKTNDILEKERDVKENVKTVAVSELAIEETTYQAKAVGEDVVVEYELENDIEVTVETEKDWIKVKLNKKSNKIVCTVTENDSTDKRVGKVTVQNGEVGDPIIVTIEQAGKPELKLEKNDFTLKSTGESCVINYELKNRIDGVEVIVKGDKSWITATVESENKIFVKVDKNDGDKRTATIEVSYGDLKQKITVYQKAAKKVTPADVEEEKTPEVQKPEETETTQSVAIG